MSLSYFQKLLNVINVIKSSNYNVLSKHKKLKIKPK